MRKRFERLLDHPRTVWLATALTLAIGAFFLFVWSPLPFGWYGIDHYHERAQRLAAGQPFDTTDVPWAYAYYLAAFYRVFGPTPLPPLVVQVLLNAAMPLLLYRIAQPIVGSRSAIAAALLIGVFSFNTVYASTQSSDAICTVLFATFMLCYLRGRRGDGLRWFVFAGLLGGIAAQFRPNLLLFPLLLAAIELFFAPSIKQKVTRAAILAGCMAVMLAPWILRNYRLTGEFLPTSTHGGVQLWYGTLQTGRYLESRAHNPRSAFEGHAFEYTVLADRSIVITAQTLCPDTAPRSPGLVYWTDRDRQPIRVMPLVSNGTHVEFMLPSQSAPTTLYYYLEARAPDGQLRVTPSGGVSNPLVFFIADDHFSDLDRHDDVLDAFDVIRMLRWYGWKEPLRASQALDFDRDGAIDRKDITLAAQTLLEAAGEQRPHDVGDINVEADAVTLRLADGSWLRVPRSFSGNLTDVTTEGTLAAKLLYSRRTFTSLSAPPAIGHPCAAFENVAANDVFYRKEPHLMRRYSALAFDNIKRDPAGFAAATIYRMFRLFIIRGTDDRMTTQQFTASSVIYPIGTLLSAALFAAMIAGIWLSARRGAPVWPLVLPIAYVAVTLAPVLTNMRYTTTVQPYVFVFAAVTLLAVFKIQPKPRREGTRTTLQP